MLQPHPPVLPPELLLKILLCLEVHDLLNCRLASFAFDSLISETRELLCEIELWNHGYEDAPSRNHNHSARLQTIKLIQQQWDNLNGSTFDSTFPTNFTHLWRFQTYTVSEGVLLVMPSNGVQSIICRRTIPVDRLLLRFDLNEVFRSKQLTPRTLDVDRPFIGAHAFPREELLVLQRVVSHVPDGALVSFIHPDFYSVELDLRSLNDGRPHLRAEQTCLRLPSNEHIHLEINVSGDFLIVYDLTSTGTSVMRTGWGVHLYHWPTGQLIKTWSCVPDEVLTLGGTLLREDTILIPTIKLLGRTPVMSLDQYSLRCNAWGRWTCVLARRFMLPTLHSIDILRRIRTVHLWVQDRAGISLTSSTCRPSSRLVELHFPECIMIIRRSAFFNPYHDDLVEIEGTVRTIPWNAWGPHNSRILGIDLPSAQPVISGYRVICGNEIFDFCPRRLGDPPSNDSVGEDEERDNIQAPSKVSPSMFAKEVITSLPCRRTSLSDRLQPTRQSRPHLVETAEGPKWVRVHHIENNNHASVQIRSISVT